MFAQVDCDKYSGNYLPKDLEDALNYLDCKWSEEDKDVFRFKHEDEAIAELHFGEGRRIRNSWGLWKGDSEIAKYFHDLGVNHPDGMSGIISTSFHRFLNNSDIRIEEQIDQYKLYMEKCKVDRINRKRKEFEKFSVNDTVEFDYPYEFISKAQEDKWIDDLCFAKGIVTAKDSSEFTLQVRLIESCDNKGIILSKYDVYIKKEEKWIIKEKDKVDIMKVGEIRWTNYDSWYLIE
jgi:hypothetical protein